MVRGLALKAAILSSLLVLLSVLSSIASISAIASSFNFFSAALKSLFAFCTLAILGSNSLFTSLSNEYFLLLLSALGLTIFSFSTGSVIASVAALEEQVRMQQAQVGATVKRMSGSSTSVRDVAANRAAELASLSPSNSQFNWVKDT